MQAFYCAVLSLFLSTALGSNGVVTDSGAVATPEPFVDQKVTNDSNPYLKPAINALLLGYLEGQLKEHVDCLKPWSGDGSKELLEPMVQRITEVGRQFDRVFAYGFWELAFCLEYADNNALAQLLDLLGRLDGYCKAIDQKLQSVSASSPETECQMRLFVASRFLLAKTRVLKTALARLISPALQASLLPRGLLGPRAAFLLVEILKGILKGNLLVAYCLAIIDLGFMQLQRNGSSCAKAFDHKIKEITAHLSTIAQNQGLLRAEFGENGYNDEFLEGCTKLLQGLQFLSWSQYLRLSLYALVQRVSQLSTLKSFSQRLIVAGSSLLDVQEILMNIRINNTELARSLQFDPIDTRETQQLLWDEFEHSMSRAQSLRESVDTIFSNIASLWLIPLEDCIVALLDLTLLLGALTVCSATKEPGVAEKATEYRKKGVDFVKESAQALHKSVSSEVAKYGAFHLCRPRVRLLYRLSLVAQNMSANPNYQPAVPIFPWLAVQPNPIFPLDS